MMEWDEEYDEYMEEEIEDDPEQNISRELRHRMYGGQKIIQTSRTRNSRQKKSRWLKKS